MESYLNKKSLMILDLFISPKKKGIISDFILTLKTKATKRYKIEFINELIAQDIFTAIDTHRWNGRETIIYQVNKKELYKLWKKTLLGEKVTSAYTQLDILLD